MKILEFFHIPDAPESTVELPQGLALIDAKVDAQDEIRIYFVDDQISDDKVTITFYVLGLESEVADNFPGRYFKRLETSDGRDRFIYFKQNAKKREPIVAKVPDAKPPARQEVS